MTERRDDFEATIRIYRPEEGGRQTSAYNGIRWDFTYECSRPDEGCYLIWPDFCLPDGRSFPAEQPLPVGVELLARMTVLCEELRASVHRGRIQPGVRFFCQEGHRRVAEGVVIRLTGLDVAT